MLPFVDCFHKASQIKRVMWNVVNAREDGKEPESLSVLLLFRIPEIPLLAPNSERKVTFSSFVISELDCALNPSIAGE